ncbi:MAG: hypothetical protein NT159_07830 [Proteobacteria bacterium]|nr:hypothetical protein [Pseudomonadota bacterium]
MEWLAASFGVLGAALLALHFEYSGWGFAAFLVSNTCWIVWGIRAKASGLLFQQVAFTFTSLYGICQWL